MFPPRLETPVVNLPHAARLPMALALLALAVVACAPASPSQYAQGAPMAPRAPAFSPAEDAPYTVGQPGHMRPGIHLEPNPRPDRILPEDEHTRREPGLWANSAAPAITPSIARVALPLPEAQEAHDVVVVSHCGGSMDLAIKWSNLEGAVGRLMPAERGCLAALLYQFCASHLIPSPDGAKSQREAEVRRAAQGAARKMCTKETRAAVDDLVFTITAEWLDKNMHAMRAP